MLFLIKYDVAINIKNKSSIMKIDVLKTIFLLLYFMIKYILNIEIYIM